MNLGQLIGELRMRAEAAEAGQPAKPKTRRQPHGEVSKRLLDIIQAASEPLAAEEIFGRAGLAASERHNAYVTLRSLEHGGWIKHFGERRSYRWEAVRA